MNTAHSGEQTSTCRRCGGCCRIRGFVRVGSTEIDRIAELLRISPRSFADRYTRLAYDRCGLELLEKESGECIFLEGTACEIHSVKPEQCRTFPDGWRYPGVEEICPACGGKSQIPNPKSQTPIEGMCSAYGGKSQIPNPKSQTPIEDMCSACGGKSQ